MPASGMRGEKAAPDRPRAAAGVWAGWGTRMGNEACGGGASATIVCPVVIVVIGSVCIVITGGDCCKS